MPLSKEDARTTFDSEGILSSVTRDDDVTVALEGKTIGMPTLETGSYSWRG